VALRARSSVPAVTAPAPAAPPTRPSRPGRPTPAARTGRPPTWPPTPTRTPAPRSMTAMASQAGWLEIGGTSEATRSSRPPTPWPARPVLAKTRPNTHTSTPANSTTSSRAATAHAARCTCATASRLQRVDRQRAPGRHRSIPRCRQHRHGHRWLAAEGDIARPVTLDRRHLGLEDSDKGDPRVGQDKADRRGSGGEDLLAVPVEVFAGGQLGVDGEQQRL
jgi:hypothetical protein